MSAAFTAQYEVPTTGTLMMEIAGKTREATKADLAKMDLCQSAEAYMAFDDALVAAMNSNPATALERNKHIVKCHLNPVRYLTELSVRYGWRTTTIAVEDETLEDVAAIEQTLKLIAEGQDEDAGAFYRAHLAKREQATS